MKSERLFLSCGVVALMLLNLSCSNKKVNTAVSSTGAKVGFTQMGEGEPAIIFVHGWANDATIWNETLSHFSGRYKTVAVDLYGTDESYIERSDWSMASFGEDVASVVRKLRLKRVVLVGFSMGLAVIAETAKLLPERTIGLVIVDDLQDVDMKYSPETIAFMDSVLMDVATDPTNRKLVDGVLQEEPGKSFNGSRRCLKVLRGPGGKDRCMLISNGLTTIVQGRSDK